LSVAGLILQVFFRNPLAGPGVLGITSGASLGVAVVLLGGIGVGTWLGTMGVFVAGIIGALFVLFLLMIVSRFIANQVTLLVAGLMFGYFTAAIVNILYLWANESQTRAYVIWGLGSFEGLSTRQSWILFGFVLLVAVSSLLLSKSLNALVLGPEYAASMGINIKRSKLAIILVTGVLAATVTVFCGPISFIGIAVPQLIRHVVRSKNHAYIIPLTFFGGSLLALLADLLVRSSSNSLPLNTVTAIVGAPVIIWLIIKMNRSNAGF
jgi:iron complex transport system permease protein